MWIVAHVGKGLKVVLRILAHMKKGPKALLLMVAGMKEGTRVSYCGWWCTLERVQTSHYESWHT